LTEKERFQITKTFLDYLALGLQVGNAKIVNGALAIIADWSYAHRVGNGENSDSQQQKIIDRQYQRMKEYV
jgi:hypothetical protein